MIGTNSFFYIMDYSGNYYRTNKSDQLVVASGREEAEIFTLKDANSRTSVGRKSHFYLISPVEEREEATSNEQMNLVEEITDVTPNEQMNSAEDTAEPTLLHGYADQITDETDYIEDSKYNVTEGYKVYKDLRNLKQLQKQKEHELDLLYNMTMYIDCQNMADICKENLEEMEKIDLTETMKISA